MKYLPIFLINFAEVNRKGPINTLRAAIPALLLVAWYLLAVTGIDIHDDSEHGRTYVVCSISGGDCEHIHPEAHCHDEAAEGTCLAGEDCCSDCYEAVLSLSSNEDGAGLDFTVPYVDVLYSSCILSDPFVSVVRHAARTHAPPPGGGDRLSVLCMLRA